MAHRDDLGLGDGGGGGGARARVEQRQLAEHLARAEDRQEVLAAVAAGAAELDLALADDVEPVALVALVEEDVAALEPRRAHRGDEAAAVWSSRAANRGALRTTS